MGNALPSRFPFGTLVINVSGCLVIGFFSTLVSERISIHPNWRLAIAVGFVGAYTTFYTFEYETFKLIESGSSAGALMNVVISLILGFLAVWGGIAAARTIFRPSIAAPATRTATARATTQRLNATQDHGSATAAESSGRTETGVKKEEGETWTA